MTNPKQTCKNAAVNRTAHDCLVCYLQTLNQPLKPKITTTIHAELPCRLCSPGFRKTPQGQVLAICLLLSTFLMFLPLLLFSSAKHVMMLWATQLALPIRGPLAAGLPPQFAAGHHGVLHPQLSWSKVTELPTENINKWHMRTLSG